MPEENDKAASSVSAVENARIMGYIVAYKRINPQVGDLLAGIWSDLKHNPENFRGKDARNVIEDRIQGIVDRKITDFAKHWNVNEAELRAYVRTTPVSEVVPEKINTAMGNYQAFKEAGGTGSKLAYFKHLREGVVKLAATEIKPLMRL